MSVIKLIFVRATAACVPALFASHAAFAQPSSAVRQACMQDVQRLCSGVSPGGGRIRACMMQHVQDLSPDCKAALAAQRGAGG